jgi:ribose 5-phosphate isomerase A
MSADIGKMRAAAAALDFVSSGMTVGLGTGSTAAHFVHLLADKVRMGLDIKGIPTSEDTRRLASSLAIPLIEIDQADRIHVTVDGTDEVDPSFRLIKGGGGALLREKIVANASDHVVIIADSTKAVSRLGAFPLPVEVTAFGFTITAKKIFDIMAAHGCPGRDVRVREAGQAGKAFTSDGGNYILDCHCEAIGDPESLARALSALPGVVEHGLFLGLARTVLLGSPGGVEMREC